MPSNAWSSFTLKPWLCLTAFQGKLLTAVQMVLVELLLLRLLLWLILILLLKEKNKETKKRASKPFFCYMPYSFFRVL